METIKLYDNQVHLRFGAASHRYTVSLDQGKTWDYMPGVTTILGSTLAKPMLMLWPLDEALKYLFGQKFDEQTQDNGDIIVKPLYEPSKALLKANKPLTANELQAALEAARSAHTQKRDKGGDVGHDVHAHIEKYLTTGEAPKLAGPAGKSFQAFVDWFEDQSIEVLGTEQVVYSREFEYAGTFDALLEIDGKRVLADIKTSNYSRTAPKGIYADNFLQLGGYALAYQEEFGDTVDDCLIINCSKQGKVNAVYASELGYTPQDLQLTFVNAFGLYLAMQNLTKGLKNAKN